MATTKKFLDYTGLTSYDEKIKAKIAADDATTLASAKSYADGLAVNYDPKGTAQTKVNELANGQVKTNTDAIATLNGNASVAGSVDQKIASVKTELEGEIANSMYDDTSLKNRISANETAISTLNGTGVGSVSKQVSDAVAALVADAPEAYDTLKEISDWISSHSSDAAAMNSQINTNKSDIAGLITLIGTLPESASSSTIVAYISEIVGASKTELTSAIATAKSEAISTASSDATTKANQALSDAKDYTDGLAPNYATAAQGTKADSALQSSDIVTGSANGTISVKGTDVAVKGLGSAAYTPSTSYDLAGTAENKVNSLANGAVATNTSDISTLKSKVSALESIEYIEITEEEITAMFS